MKVVLAGYNVDAEVLRQLKEGEHDGSDNVTPEVISAAYARISRDPRPVDELRAEGRGKVKRARRSNRNIVFDMGHHSIAEHAVLNYDVIGVSRLAIEALEHHRLCSFTEKSQRYILLEGDYVVPDEFDETERRWFEELVGKQNDFYFKILPELVGYQETRNPELDGKGVESLAKEDARYALSLATEGQLGFTANARNLEYVVRKFKYHPLAEVRELGLRLYEEAKEVVPSLIILADEEEFEKTQGTTLEEGFLKRGRKDVNAATTNLLKEVGHKKEYGGKGTRLVRFDGLDEEIISSMIAYRGGISFVAAKEIFGGLSGEQKKKYIQDSLKNVGRHDSLLREFEMAELVFEVVMSASCFAQMKRHRMCTLLPGSYDVGLGITVPESIKNLGLDRELESLARESGDLAERIGEGHLNREVGIYCLTNAHQRRVVVKTNLRELYHISRLREDGHAQWDIRKKVGEMVELAKVVSPMTTMLLGGKDKFDAVRGEVYGE